MGQLIHHGHHEHVASPQAGGCQQAGTTRHGSPGHSPCSSQPPDRLLLQDCLALGAIFATTDSVAVLQVLEQDRAPLLFSFVFGEGVINDATTVALLRTVQVR